MDGRRFDSIARSLAAWSTRRKFLSGLTGAAAAGGALVYASHASAQAGTCNPPVDVLSECAGFSGSDSNDAIAQKSSDTLAKIKTLGDFALPENHFWDRPQLPEFVGQIRCVLEQGTHATDNGGWSAEQRTVFMSQVRGIITGVSIGFTGAFFTGQKKPPATPSAAAPDGVHALLARDERSSCEPSGCVSNALTGALACWQDCNQNSDCYSKCFIDFINAYFIGTDTDPACAALVKEFCTGDCCGICIP